MNFQMQCQVFLLCIYIMQIRLNDALPCDSCGNECANACGTKHFRTCCFNYLRKRSDSTAQKLITNKRLIDFILLQGRALYTQNELSRDRDDRPWKRQSMQRNGTLLDHTGMRYYY